MRQEKRKIFSNFFAKTSTVFLYSVRQYPKLFQRSRRSLCHFMPKHFEIGQTTRSVERDQVDPDPPPDKFFFLTPNVASL